MTTPTTKTNPYVPHSADVGNLSDEHQALIVIQNDGQHPERSALMTAASAAAATRFDLTPSGRDALAIDDAIQHRLDAEALDAIAALLRAGGSGPWMLDRIAEQVAVSRRHIIARLRQLE